ncbi:unnamed protein product [Adineta steineri]|uniref:Uncharacterized protein n=1 Tax=Adineta steineri TaxID=433720 RepID=A0A820GL00_9BILA|nr:unnamed protein product [Adineta steineri]
MASSARFCFINECKRSWRSLCFCCQHNLCLDHLVEHENLIHAQIPLITDQINSLSHLLDDDIVIQPSCFIDLNQWRENALRTIEQLYEGKRQQLEDLIQRRRNKQQQEFDEMKMKFEELIKNQEGTKEEIDFMRKSVEFIKKDIEDLHHIHFNINQLVIDDNLISIQNETTNNDNHLRKRRVTCPGK